MADRIVSIKLLADATGMVLGLGKARDAVAETKAKVEESARSNREAWSTVGVGLTAVGVAITGIGALALKTGISYNSMQQSTRAALTTLLGSAAAANAQMDKLDAFARNSPFAKQTFIAAQQQMLAFGIETQKVIPYLDAVQNAVAAAGGSNADIEGIVATMSKIQSSSKITAQDLNEFGNRGVNAAELIGSQMGKTGAQIREDITSGSLDATQALDALASGMSDRFGGAADNVKQTFDGAMDRVKAAWRDFAAELAKPLVDPNGGGALVDLLNWTADAMRNFEKLPEPVKNTVSALTGLVGVGSLAAGAAILAIPQWVAFKDALVTLGVTSGTARGGLANIVRFLGGPWGIAMAAAALSVVAFNKAMDNSKTSAAQFEVGIKQGADALDLMRENAAKNEQGLARAFINVGQHVEGLPALLDKAATSGRGFFSSLSFNEQAMLDNLSEFGVTLEGLASTDLPRAQSEFAKFAESADLSREQLAVALGEMPGFKSALLDYADAAGLATDDSTLLALAMGEIKTSQPKSELEELQGAAVDTSEAVEKLADEIRNFGSAQMDAEKAAIDFESEITKLNERLAEGATGLDITTQAGRDNRESLLDLAAAANESAAAAVAATGSQDSATAALQRGRDALIAAGIQYGLTEDEARAYADSVLATPETVATWIQMNGADEAEAKLAWVARRREALIEIKTSGGAGSGALNWNPGGGAYGGTVGSLPVGFANGGTVPGIGGYVSGGTVYGRGSSKSDSVFTLLSRGEEVIQEPFASMNRDLLKSINRGDFHAGMIQPQVVVAGGGGSTQVSLAGARFVFEVEGRPFTGIIREQIAGASSAGGSRVSRGSDRRF